jgi:outer membrane protein assembly factor BamB
VAAAVKAMRWVGALLLAACARGPAPGTAAPRLERDADSGVSLVAQSRGLDVVVVPGRVIVLEADRRHVHAIEPGSGEVAWRRRVFDEAEGPTALAIGPALVFVHVGRSLAILDARDGYPVAQRSDAPSSADHRIAHEDGACAFVSADGLIPFACDTGIERGPRLSGSGEPARVLGHAGGRDIVQASVDGPVGLVAVAADGRIAWRAPLTAPPPHTLGVVDVLDAVWVVSSSRTTLLRASTGQLRWSVATPITPLRAAVEGSNLIVAGRDGRRQTVFAIDLGTGRIRWSKRLPQRHEILLPEDDPAALGDGKYRVFDVIEPDSGNIAGTVAIGPYERLWRDRDGGLVRTGGDIEELSAQGDLLRQAPFAADPVLALGSTHLVTGIDGDVVFHDRITLRDLARLHGGFRPIDDGGALGAHRVLLGRAEGSRWRYLVIGLEPPRRRLAEGAAPAVDR